MQIFQMLHLNSKIVAYFWKFALIQYTRLYTIMH